MRLRSSLPATTESLHGTEQHVEMAQSEADEVAQPIGSIDRPEVCAMHLLVPFCAWAIMARTLLLSTACPANCLFTEPQ
jgi:hypothetical protein